jgi:hypothetical protein
MWNFFIIFFYEMSLELSISIALGYNLLYSTNELEEEIPADERVHNWHRAMYYFFSPLFLIVFILICVVLLQKAEHIEVLEDKIGSVYSELRYKDVP